MLLVLASIDSGYMLLTCTPWQILPRKHGVETSIPRLGILTFPSAPMVLGEKFGAYIIAANLIPLMSSSARVSLLAAMALALVFVSFMERGKRLIKRKAYDKCK